MAGCKSEEHRKNISNSIRKLWTNKTYRNRMTTVHNSTIVKEHHRDAGIRCMTSEGIERMRKMGLSSKRKRGPNF